MLFYTKRLRTMKLNSGKYMKDFVTDILICKVSYNWYQVIKSDYIINGSSVINCWYTDEEESELGLEAHEQLPAPGSLALFLVEKNGYQYIVGGGFYLSRQFLYPDSCWNEFGIKNGYLTKDTFIKRLFSCGGDPEVPVSCYQMYGTFVFTKSHILRLPDGFEMDLNHKSRITLNRNLPLSAYLKKTCMERRSLQLDKNSRNASWPGIYFKATLHRTYNFKDHFKTKVFGVYHHKCAVTGCSLIDALRVAFIRIFYDERYLSTPNAIVLRADLFKLFSKGIITARYKDETTVVLEVSKNLAVGSASEYRQYDGKELFLPENRVDWPSKEFLDWHYNIRYENWLKNSQFSLADFVNDEEDTIPNYENSNSGSKLSDRT